MQPESSLVVLRVKQDQLNSASGIGIFFVSIALLPVSIFPRNPLSDRVQKLIVDTFEVSENEAREHATRLVALADGWGSEEKAQGLDWTNRIKKDLGKQLKWRCDTERLNFEAEVGAKIAAYEKYISDGKRRIQ